MGNTKQTWSTVVAPSGDARTASARSGLRCDVVVGAEEIRRVVGALNTDEPVVVAAVGGTDPVLALVAGFAQIVHVDPALGVRQDRRPDVSRPPDIRLVLRRVVPGGDEEQ